MADDGAHPRTFIGRAPHGLAALLAGAAATVPIFQFDALEAAASRWAGEGPATLLVVVAAFALVWLAVGLPLLALLAPRPAREGVGAGGVVALGMLWFLVGDGPDPAEVPIRLFLWVPFSGLAVGFGAVTGLLAQRLRGASPAGGRGAAYAAVAGMALLAVASLAFVGPVNGPLTWGVLAIVAVVAGSAWAWLAAEGRRGRAD